MKYFTYVLACVTTALLVSWASAGGFIINPTDPEPPEDETLTEMVEMPAGTIHRTDDIDIKMIRLGVSYNVDGDPVVFGAVFADSKKARAMAEPIAALVLKRRVYFCTPGTIVTASTMVYDQKDNLLAEPNSTVIPLFPEKGSFQELELKFMCKDVARGICTNRKCV